MVLKGDLGGPLGIEEATEPGVLERLRSKGTIRFKIRHNQLVTFKRVYMTLVEMVKPIFSRRSLNLTQRVAK
jgi:hypothetical protein